MDTSANYTLSSEPEFDESILTPNEQEQIKEYSQKITIDNSNQIIRYGAFAQRKIADYSTDVLNALKSTDINDISGSLNNVISNLEEYNKSQSWFRQLWNRIFKSNAMVLNQNVSTRTHVNSLYKQLDTKEAQLLKNAALIEKTYELNKTCYKELTMYIQAGELKLKNIHNIDLPDLERKYQITNQEKYNQEVINIRHLSERFDKKLSDLRITRLISLQMAPQLKLIQKNDLALAARIHFTTTSTIPLWKTQMDAIAQLIEGNNAGLTEQKEILNESRDTLIDSLDKVIQVQTQAQKEREEIENELTQLESRIKTLS